jgi:SAM-dependent methyltransferase
MKQQFFICPRCRTGLDRVSADRLVCPQDGLEYWNVEGIWRFLLPESQAHYTRFIEEYETVRRTEGRGSTDADYYRALPYKDLSGNFSKDWAIRTRSFDLLVKKLLTPIQANLERPLKVLDLGAGNGWLSNRLAAQDDRVVAVDLLVNELDGLGAWKHYENQFTPIQAEFNRLPIMDGFADVAIFNASFHYSENYEETLKEALRATDVDGVVVVMGTPVYRRRESGEKMVAEREAAFQEQYGFASNSLESENFLTYDRLIELGDSLGIHWLTFRPFYGLRWMLRPLKAVLTRTREPARFHLIAGYRKED